MSEIRGVVQLDAPARVNDNEDEELPTMGADQDADIAHTEVELQPPEKTDVEDDKEDEEETPKMVEDAARMASTVAARAAFMAGFTYYQIGRYRYTPTVSYSDSEDILYVIFTTISFQASVLVAILGFSFSYYLNRAKNKHSFCIININVTRFCYMLLCFSSQCYLLGLGWSKFE